MKQVTFKLDHERWDLEMQKKLCTFLLTGKARVKAWGLESEETYRQTSINFHLDMGYAKKERQIWKGRLKQMMKKDEY